MNGRLAPYSISHCTSASRQCLLGDGCSRNGYGSAFRAKLRKNGAGYNGQEARDSMERTSTRAGTDDGVLLIGMCAQATVSVGKRDVST